MPEQYTQNELRQMPVGSTFTWYQPGANRHMEVVDEPGLWYEIWHDAPFTHGDSSDEYDERYLMDHYDMEYVGRSDRWILTLGEECKLHDKIMELTT